MDNFMPDNPYVLFALQFKQLFSEQKKLQHDLIVLQEQFRAVFNPDDVLFMELITRAQKAIADKKPFEELDTYYRQMLAIYEKWLPIEEYITAYNPSYVPLFVTLKSYKKQKEDEKENNTHLASSSTVNRRLPKRHVTRRPRTKV